MSLRERWQRRWQREPELGCWLVNFGLGLGGAAIAVPALPAPRPTDPGARPRR